MTPRVCLVMIVKNESDRILRCLKSVAPFIDCWAIHDTGSTDDTIAQIEAYFAAQNIPGAVTRGAFVDFSQARNASLEAARSLPSDYEYMMLVDADMELVAPTDFRGQLVGPSHTAMQRANGMVYANVRFVKRGQPATYVGATHEYLDVTPGSLIMGAEFIDHADGANRANKFERDVTLLKASLTAEPENTRTWFYLAQSYFDLGNYQAAADAYQKRVGMGGWAEERWYAQVKFARCMKELGRERDYIETMLVAYNMRPQRGETLHELAKHYRERGDHALAMLYAEAGLRTPMPRDSLFLMEYPYKVGFLEEISISAFYNPDPLVQGRGKAACNFLSLQKDGTPQSRNMARANMYWYLASLATLAPSFAPKRLAFVPPEKCTATNPSITRYKGKLYVNVRTVNYTITPEGRYAIVGEDDTINDHNPIRTRNFLCALGTDFEPTKIREIVVDPSPLAGRYPLVIGQEDVRLYSFKGRLWGSACMRELNPEGWCEQVFFEIDPETGRGTAPTRMLPDTRAHEKNWMPFNGGFVYKLGQIVDTAGKITPTDCKAAAEQLRGGSQLITLDNGYLAIVHEAGARPDGHRFYSHRFVFFNAKGDVQAISQPFVFHDRQIEFAAGLAWHQDGHRLIISYGVLDREAWVATISKLEVKRMLGMD